MGRPSLPPPAPRRWDARGERGLRPPLGDGAHTPAAPSAAAASALVGRPPGPGSGSADAGGRGSAGASVKNVVFAFSDFADDDPAVEVEFSGVPALPPAFFPFLLGVPLSPLALRGAGFAGEAFGDGGRFETAKGAAEGVAPDGDALGDTKRRGDIGGARAWADRGVCCCC